jgi:hypothetical protein
MWTTAVVLAAGVAVGQGPEVAPAPRPAPPVLDPNTGRGAGDTLNRLAGQLAESGRPTEQQVDALFLAALGRFATAGEQERARKKYGKALTAGQLREVLAEVAAAPGFRTHAESLQAWLPGPTPRLLVGPGCGCRLFPGCPYFPPAHDTSLCPFCSRAILGRAVVGDRPGWRPTYPPGLLPLVPWVAPGVPTEPYLIQKFRPAGAPGFRDPPPKP